MPRFIILVGLLVALVGLATLPLYAQSSAVVYDGVYSGQTSDGERFTMVVEGRTIVSVIVRVYVRGGAPDWCTGDVYFFANNQPDGMLYLDDPTFALFWEQDGLALNLVGEITPSGAEGSMVLVVTGDNRPCKGRGEANWQASRDATVPPPQPALPTVPPPVTPAPASPEPISTAAPIATVPLPALTPTANPGVNPARSGAVTFAGTDDEVIEQFLLPASISRVRILHTGDGPFRVVAFPADGSAETVLIDTTGQYNGVRLLRGETYLLEITADALWELIVEPVPYVDQFLDNYSGTGDQVSDLFPSFGGARAYRFTHDGQGDFDVYLRCAEGDNQVIDANGMVDTEAVSVFNGSPCLWQVRANGNWTIVAQ
ncbi:MAG: hypothetical protein HC914_15280 [Chloroflexaceae bacterium]|nr:hypothetical protein [Chloroflexaceae bacterium]